MEYLKLLTILALIALTGCNAAQQAAIDAAVQQRKAVADQEAELSLVLPCGMTVGAFFRLSVNQRRAVEALCGGEPMPRKEDL